MPESPLVSVIIPAYNAELVIGESLASVQQQTYRRFEAIVVDDGSTDRTDQIAQRFAKADSRFICLRQTNAGVSAARNAALIRAQGELIAFLDADDWWLPDKLPSQIRLREQEPRAGLYFTNYFVWDGKNEGGQRYTSPRKFPDGDVTRRLIFFNLFGISTVMITRETLDAVGLFDADLPPAEDWDLWLRVAELGLCAKGIRKPLARYRVWSGNASRNTMRLCQANVRVLEKALARPTAEKWRRDYRRSLQLARGNLELARVRSILETAPGAVPAAAFRAWRHRPARTKWLLWSVAAWWPRALGGRFLAGIVHRKIRRKW